MGVALGCRGVAEPCRGVAAPAWRGVRPDDICQGGTFAFGLPKPEGAAELSCPVNCPLFTVTVLYWASNSILTSESVEDTTRPL